MSTVTLSVLLSARQVPRAAMAILALLLGSGRPGLLLPLLSEELRGPSCVQQLVLLAGDAWARPCASHSCDQLCHHKHIFR